MDLARRRRRRRIIRACLMGTFSLITLAALVVVAGMVVKLDRTGSHALAPAALSTGAAAIQGDALVTRTVLTDRKADLTYMQLGTPWHGGCPRGLSTTEFRWTGGEAAVAGRLPSGTDWYGNACSGPLPQQFRGQPLGQAAWRLADAIEPIYYGALRYTVAVKLSTAVRVEGRPGWLAEFLVRYSGTPHLAWSSELAAVVITSKSVFYVSVPDNLGSGTVATLLSSLR